MHNDKKNFALEAEEFTFARLPVHWDPVATHAFKADVARTGLAIVGEVHGVVENPLVYALIMEEFGIVSLGYEWESDSYSPAMKFASGGKLDMAMFRKSRDGRVTPGHFALLRELERQKKLSRFYCFDYWEREGNFRDWGMCENLTYAITEGDPILAAMGKWHAGFCEYGTGEREETAASLIEKKVPGVPRIGITYLSGTYWNERLKKFPRTESNLRVQFRKTGTPHEYEFVLPSATAAIVPAM